MHRQELSTRQYLLIQTLNEHVAPMKSAALCSLLGVSPRTLRYEIKAINSIAQTSIIVSGRTGYSLSQNTDCKNFLNEISIATGDDLVERIAIALLETSQVNVFDLEQQLYASVSTIEDRLDAVNERMKPFYLLARKRGDIMWIEGTEHNKRRMISSLLSVEVNDLTNGQESFGAYLKHVSMKRAENIIRKALDDVSISLNTVYFNNLVIVLSVSLDRIVGMHLVGEEDTLTDSSGTSDTIEPFLTAFVARVREELNVVLSVRELSSIQGLIAGIITNGTPVDLDDDLPAVVRKALDTTLDHYHLTIDYDSFFDRFLLHVYYMLLRAQNEGWFETELAEPIRNAHPLLWELSVFFCDELNKGFNTKIPEDEIGLVAVYIGLAVSDNVDYRPCRVALICPEYNSLRETFTAQIREHFGGQMEIAYVCDSYDQIAKIAENEIDFVISARRNEHIVRDVVSVSPIITPRELHTLEKHFMKAFKRTRAEKIRRELLELFNENMFFWYNEPMTGNEALTLMCHALTSHGLTDPSFIGSVLKREEMASTAFFKRFAIPHALDEYANKTSLVYLYNEHPIDWFGTDVHLVILLAAEEGTDSFADTYQFLFDLLTDNKLYDDMVQSRTFEEFTSFLTSAEV